MLARWLRSIEDFLWPLSCPLCERASDAVCSRCSLLMPRIRGEERVQKGPAPVEQSWAPFRYEGPLKDLLVRAKYAGRPEILPALAALLVRRLPESALLGRPDCVVPAPGSRRRRRERGFDPAAVLGAPVARALGIPLLPGALWRRREVPPQASLGRRERLANLAGVFESDGVAGRAVLLFDDVATTGATLAAAGDALMRAGARRVAAATLARTPGGRDGSPGLAAGWRPGSVGR